MRVFRKWGVLAVGLAIGAGGCGDDGGPGGSDLSDGDKQALVTALSEVEGFGAFASFAVQEIGEVGKLNAAIATHVRGAVENALRLSSSGIRAAEYDAVGFAMEFDYNIQGESFSGWFLGVIGWSGITGTTVNELVIVYGIGEDEPLPSSASGTIEDFEVFAEYLSGEDIYFGTSGTGAITGSGFSGSSRDCSGSDGQFTVNCEVTTGTMNGNFDFVAQLLGGETLYTQTPVEFTGLPALRITISVSD